MDIALMLGFLFVDMGCTLMLHTDLADASPSRKLEGYFGVTAAIQQRVGAFILVWGMFEVGCEPLIWLLRKENPVCEKSITEGQPISTWLKLLAEAGTKYSGYIDQSIRLICDAATDLLVYRNAIIHGRLSAGGPAGPHLASNTPWIGEKKRKPSRRAMITESELDVAADVADTLFKGTFGFMVAGTDVEQYEPESLKNMLVRLEDARAQARRLREIAEQDDAPIE
nr:hypothetical protein [uncultured Duganella sp.]